MTCEEHSIDLICAVSKLHIDRFVLVIHFCRNMRVGAGNIGSFLFSVFIIHRTLVLVNSFLFFSEIILFFAPSIILHLQLNVKFFSESNLLFQKYDVI